MKSIAAVKEFLSKSLKVGIKSCWLQNKINTKYKNTALWATAVNKRDSTPVSEKRRKEVFLKDFALNWQSEIKNALNGLYT